MEKFSAYRDPGTGIQPFLTPVAPPNPRSDFLLTCLIPFRIIIGTVRTAAIMLLLLVYVVLVPGLCLIFIPFPPIYRFLTRIFTFIICRTVLFILGLFWIRLDVVSRKRGRTTQPLTWEYPKKGDLIISNFVSWIDLLWLALRFNPIFLLPAPEGSVTQSTISSSPITRNPSRRTDTGSANVASSTTHMSTTRVPIKGFHTVSLLTAICMTAYVPPFPFKATSPPRSIADIRKSVDRPIVVFPECTTSNGRGLLQFAKVFGNQDVPIKDYNVFVLCIRYDPPTTFSPSLAHSIPSSRCNPLPHLFTIASSFSVPNMSVRLLAPSESPSSPLFMASDFLINGVPSEDQLSEVSAALIVQIGKFKRTGMAWENKFNFLQFYQGKSSR